MVRLLIDAKRDVLLDHCWDDGLQNIIDNTD
jgi:hypothetical protein